MPNQIQLKDAEQDQEIALLKHRVEELEENGVDELRQRVRKLEKTVWSASCLLYTSPSPRDRQKSRMPSSA